MLQIWMILRLRSLRAGAYGYIFIRRSTSETLRLRTLRCLLSVPGAGGGGPLVGALSAVELSRRKMWCEKMRCVPEGHLTVEAGSQHGRRCNDGRQLPLF